jgi:secondary thiamine-phosphate synthase enzyme
MMVIKPEGYSFETKESLQFIDITKQVENFVLKEKVTDGLMTICSQHTTMSVVVNEKEELLLKDIRDHLYEFAPLGKKYRHDDLAKRRCPPNEPKNAHAHLQALMLGAAQTVPVRNGVLCLGKWQRILLIELDGPRKRKITMTLVANRKK